MFSCQKITVKQYITVTLIFIVWHTEQRVCHRYIYRLSIGKGY